ncbi:hypothetical protein BB559_004846 [Furculomyces boomerangus]|uniref:DUF1748-domain-containing protein n=2 Tax=Harpellales TaxID=61421 RepID=A0A2T9YC93_9FUNG|nr:hypothetical protein BB559_004846 [Furculomyces boomerangus]PWA00876.1 hypothetical protein BB558_003058 [Smittium angustum]
MGFTGKLIHFTVDAVMLSTLLAGIKRSTGWTIKYEELSKEEPAAHYIGRYLDIGEKTFDFALSNMKKYPSIFEKPSK